MTRITGSLVILSCVASVALPAGASIIGTFDGSGSYATFPDLLCGYRAFMGIPQNTITFAELALGANPVGNFYTASKGVTFSDEGSVVILSEGYQVVAGWYQESLAGYDGSYMPDGATVYNKIYDDNPNSPLTITFNVPVSSVGSFIANSAGAPSSLTVNMYGAADQLLGTVMAQVNPWGDSGNIEGFWGIQTDLPEITKVTILSSGNYGVATLGNLEWSSSGLIPEPATLAMLSLGGLAMLWRRKQEGRTTIIARAIQNDAIIVYATPEGPFRASCTPLSL